MLVQDKAYLLLLMCLSMLCPAKMAVLVEAAKEQAMAYLNIRLKIRAIHYGLASRIAQVAGREFMNGRVIYMIVLHKDTMAAMAAPMAATATHGEAIKGQIPLAAWAAVTVAALVVTTLMGTVKMQHIMARVPAVADIMKDPTVI